MSRLLSMFVIALALTVPPATVLSQTATAKGQVQKVDQKAGKVTLRHESLKAFDMDMPMTMVYPVKDPSILRGLKAGDKITFRAERVNGQIIVTKIGKAK